MLAGKKYLLALLVCLSVSCNRQAKEDASSGPTVLIDLEVIKERGYLNVLVDNNSFSYFIYKGRPMGYEYELLKLLTEHLGVELRITITAGVDYAIEQLNNGIGDIIAFPLTITKERRKYVNFTKPHFNTFQVLVQRKPKNWRRLTRDQINDSVIRDPSELIDKEIHVMKSSSFAMRLRNLSEEIGGDINIKEDSLASESEGLIREVATGSIDYTVADHQIAMVNAAYYPNLDVNTVLSLPQQIAWAVRKNAPELLKAIDDWLAQIKKAPTFMVIYNRYFKSPRTSLLRIRSDYSSVSGNKISPYDDLIKQGAERLGWDWRLLAAVVYQESKFRPQDESWAGARGLMQLMPETAKQFGATNRDDPRQSLKAGVNYLRYLNRYWTKYVPDENERLKFVLASYNVGLTHVTDAQKLAEKYQKDPAVWTDNVEYFLLKKSEPKYYRDPIARAGYCRCEEPVNYVRDILERYEQYKLHISESS